MIIFGCLCVASRGATANDNDQTDNGELDHSLSSVQESASRHDHWNWLISLEQWERRHRLASQGILSTVDRLDRLFGDDSVHEVNRTRMTLGIGLVYDGRDGVSLLSDIKLRLSLPRIQERLQLVVDDAFEVDRPDDQQAIVDAVRDSKPDAGLRYFFSRKELFRLSADLGIRLRDPVQLFGRGRLSVRLPTEKWEIRITETLYWFTKDGWRESTDLTVSRPLPQEWQFRSASRVTWEEITPGITPSQTLSMTWQPGRHRALRFFLSGIWPETPNTRTANYKTGVIFRRRVHQDWLFLEVSPAVEFPQAYEYEPNVIISFKFDIVFSND